MTFVVTQTRWTRLSREISPPRKPILNDHMERRQLQLNTVMEITTYHKTNRANETSRTPEEEEKGRREEKKKRRKEEKRREKRREKKRKETRRRRRKKRERKE